MDSSLRKAAQQALEALAIGQDAANEVAQTYHEAMAGYRPARHIAVDDDVRKIKDAITALRVALAEPDLFHCPKCGGPADNGHDRSIPPSPYWCTKCMAEPAQEPVWVCPDSAEHRYQKPGHCEDCGKTLVQERHFCPRCGKRTNDIHTCTPPAPLTDEIIAELWHQNGGFHHHFARAVERWLKGNP